MHWSSIYAFEQTWQSLPSSCPLLCLLPSCLISYPVLLPDRVAVSRWKNETECKANGIYSGSMKLVTIIKSCYTIELYVFKNYATAVDNSLTQLGEWFMVLYLAFAHILIADIVLLLLLLSSQPSFAWWCGRCVIFFLTLARFGRLPLRPIRLKRTENGHLLARQVQSTHMQIRQGVWGGENLEDNMTEMVKSCKEISKQADRGWGVRMEVLEKYI